MRQENWIRVERSLESLHGHPLDVLLSKSALPSGGEAEQATRLREEALSVLLTTMRRYTPHRLPDNFMSIDT
jgi:hypothetical protein